MEYTNQELREKAKSFGVPFDPPRRLLTKLSVFKGSLAMILTGLIFVLVSIFLFVLFSTTGMLNDLFVSEWKEAKAYQIKWVASAEKVNDKHIPAIVVTFTANDGKPYTARVKITETRLKNLYWQNFQKDQNAVEHNWLNQRILIDIEYDAENPETARIKGMASSAIPLWVMIFPAVFFVVGLVLSYSAKKRTATIQNVLENGNFVIGIITDEKMSSGKSRGRRGTNAQLQIFYEFRIGTEMIEGKQFISPKRKLEFEIGQEIPVLYYEYGLSYKSYCPYFFKVEFEEF